MDTILVTGSAGFFGSILKEILLRKGFRVAGIDLEPDSFQHPEYRCYQGDINDDALMNRIFQENSVSAVMHCAALLAHVKKDIPKLWRSNADGTANVLRFAEKYQVEKIVFTSTNCLWAEDLGHPVTEEEPPRPAEIYGKSKWEAEKILLGASKMKTVIFRCPTIMDEGRLGLLGILFAFLDEGRRIWMAGSGENRYQFVYARDLADACIRALSYDRSGIFNVGSDNVKSFNEVYTYVIRHSGSGSRLVHLPGWLVIPGMKICYALGISPLGPYQYKMIASNFVFDTSKIKRELHWQPTLTNEEMLKKAYDYYHENKAEILDRHDVSAHRSVASMGIIRVIKFFS